MIGNPLDDRHPGGARAVEESPLAVENPHGTRRMIEMPVETKYGNRVTVQAARKFRTIRTVQVHHDLARWDAVSGEVLSQVFPGDDFVGMLDSRDVKESRFGDGGWLAVQYRILPRGRRRLTR